MLAPGLHVPALGKLPVGLFQSHNCKMEMRIVIALTMCLRRSAHSFMPHDCLMIISGLQKEKMKAQRGPVACSSPHWYVMEPRFKPRHAGSRIYTLTTVLYHFCFYQRILLLIRAASIPETREEDSGR